MTKLYKKSEITFTIVWIAAYVVLSSLADNVSLELGVAKSITAVLHVVMALILFFWIGKNGLMKKIWPLQIICAGKELFVLHPIGSNSIGIPVDRHRASFHNPGDDMLRCQHVLRRVH